MAWESSEEVVTVQTISFPADSADEFGGAVSATAQDGTAVDVTQFPCEVAVIPKTSRQNDPEDADWKSATWALRKGKLYADIVNVQDVTMTKGQTYAVFVGVTPAANRIYRLVGYVKAS